MTGIVFSVGVNDVSPVSLDGVHIESYAAWKNMLKRCYDRDWQEKNKTYIGCRVCDEWLTFSVFKCWFDKHYVNNWQVDKDLLHPGNMTYSPHNCIFIPKWLNTFTTAHQSARGRYPIGVSYHKKKGKYIASISIDGRRVHVGAFDDPKSAHAAWSKKKREIAFGFKEFCDEVDPRLFAGVLRKIEMMSSCRER